MNTKRLLLRSIFAASLAVGLTACGGGSSSSSSSDTGTQTESGQFLDSAVSGMEYESQPSGISGLTDDDGRFDYQVGDEIIFRVGQYFIGQTEGAELITPVTLVPESNGDTSNLKVNNIARFLQSLDDDGVADNGITINEATRLAASIQNSTDVAAADLDSQELINAITAITERNSVPRTEFISADQARKHLDGTLATLNPATACSDEEAEPVSQDKLEGSAFGFIRSDEIGVFEFFDTGEYRERSFDEQRSENLRDKSSTWIVDSINSTITLGERTFTACITEDFLLIEQGTSDDEQFARFFKVIPYELPESKESFKLRFDGEDRSILSIQSDGALELFTGIEEISPESVGEINNTSGALELDFQTQNLEGDSIISEIFFIAGQGSKTGIYLDYSEERGFAGVGTATITPTINTELFDEELMGNTYVSRDDDDNTTVILDLDFDSIYREYANDRFTNDEQQVNFINSTWFFGSDLDPEMKMLTLDGNDDPEMFKVAESANNLFFAKQNSPVFFELSKTQPINEATIPGTFTVDIPTENTRIRELVIRDDKTLSMGSFEGTWQINGNGVFEFDIGDSNTGFIWQIAGRTNAFAFVMFDKEDETDIEPGFMTRN